LLFAAFGRKRVAYDHSRGKLEYRATAVWRVAVRISSGLGGTVKVARRITDQSEGVRPILFPRESVDDGLFPSRIQLEHRPAAGGLAAGAPPRS
jgi:hypothetical protein